MRPAPLSIGVEKQLRKCMCYNASQETEDLRALSLFETALLPIMSNLEPVFSSIRCEN